MNEYISREAVVRYLKGYSEKECNSNSPYGMITSSVLNKAERALSDIPAADVQPVKHGRWSECYTDTHHYSGICSVCGRASIKSLTESLYEYCPKCGAKMCGETKYRPIKTLEDIKTICSTHLHCQEENEYCEFFDKDSGYCIFEDMPEDWEIEKNKKELLDALKKAGVKMDGDSKNASKI